VPATPRRFDYIAIRQLSRHAILYFISLLRAFRQRLRAAAVVFMIDFLHFDYFAISPLRADARHDSRYCYARRHFHAIVLLLYITYIIH
jgi:hypothetical protein